MSEILNPYIAGAPVVETSMFFGREDIFSWIERSLTGKFVNHILVLHGQRRVGKTSVLKQIPNNLPNRYIQVFFDLQGRTNTTLDRFLWWMASEIVRTVKKEADLELPKPDRNAFSDPEAFINDFLPLLRSALGERVLLLTFDEFDTLDRPDIQDSLARPLIAYLRRLIDLDGLNFIFSIGSSGNKLENMQASYTDFFKAALYRKVSFLTTDDCISLITKPVEGLISYDPKAVDKITHYTSGHPYFTQLMCHELFSRCQKTGARQIKPADVDEILPDVIERGTVNLKFVWDEASDLEKWTLAALAQEEGMALRAISQVLKGQSVRFSEADLNSGVLHLRDKDVLSDDNHFVIHLLKLWLLANRPMDRVREELVQTNPIADRYNEIGDEYRERGEIEQSIQSYQQALQAQSNNSRALVNIAAIHAGRNDHQKAAETYEQVLKLDDENIAARQGFSQAQMALAETARKRGIDDAAISAYKAILQRNPVHNEARQQMVQIYQKQAETLLASGAHDQAEKKLREALEFLPEDELLSASLEKVAAEKKAAQVRGWVQKADKAMTRQRYDEAAGMIEEAIAVDPDNQDLQKRLLEIRDSPRQERVKAYRHEAEQAIAKGNYPKAISAIETAILLAPEDKELSHWLNEMRSDQSNAQLHLHQSQAAQLQAAGDWDGAVAAWEAALKIKPNDEGLRAEMLAAQNSRQEAQVKALQARVDSTRKAGRWEEALAAMQQLLVLIPQDTTLAGELENIQAEYHQAKVRDLKKEAESAVRQEKWEDAQKAWQAYLAEVPEEAGQVEKHIARAKKNAALLNDYETAQGLIRKRQYGKAIHLLQGIIAQDATYKASSRLLVEAVEANKQRKPLLKKSWLAIGGAVIVLGILSIVFLPKIKTGLAALKVEKTQETPTEALVLQNTTPEASTTEALMLDNTATEFTLTPDPTPENAPVVPALALAVTDYISTTSPTFEDDFSTEKREWGDLGTLVIESSQLQLTFKEMNATEIIKYPKNGFLDTSQFVISYDFKIIDSGDGSMNRIFGFEFLSVQDEEYFELVFNGKGDWKISQSDNSYSILGEGNFNVHQSQNVILSVFGDNLIALLNNEVVALIEGFEKYGTSNFFFASTNGPDDFTVSYDNIQFWNLEGVELEVDQIQPTEANCGQEDVFCVGLVTDVGGIDDQSFNQSAWDGVQEFGTEHGAIINYIDSKDAKDYSANIQEFIDKDYDVVVTVGFALGTSTIEVAKSKPNVFFIGVDQNQSTEVLPNVTGLIFDETKAGFLAGALAGMLTENNIIAAVLGTDLIPSVVNFNQGYIAGAKYVDRAINVISTYHSGGMDSFTDPEWGAATAKKSLEQGADVVFSAAGGSNKGALIETAGIPGAYCIGVDSDQWEAIPEAHACLVSSAMKLITPGVFDLLKLAKIGTFPSGNFIGDVGLAPFHDFDSNISQEIKDKLAKAEADFDAGKTTIQSPDPEWVTDFGDPILAYIANQTPKRVDNFETLSSFWNWTNCESKNRYVSDGKLFLKDCETTADYLYTLDFVAELNIRREQGSGGMGLLVGKHGECRIGVGFGGTGALNDVMNTDVRCTKGNLVSGYIPYTSIVNILIIVKGNDFAYYINHNPMGFSENEFIQGYYPFIRLYSEKYEGIFLASFSDFKLWDISGLDLP